MWSVLTTSPKAGNAVGSLLVVAALTVLRWQEVFVLLGMYTFGHLYSCQFCFVSILCFSFLLYVDARSAVIQHAIA